MTDDQRHTELVYGDVNDDDFEVFEDRLQDSPQGPDTQLLPRELSHVPTALPEAASQIRAVTMSVGATWEPWQALPRDEDRIKLLIELHPQVATDHLRIASSREDILSPMTSGVFGNGSYDLGEHTGAVWIYGPDLTDTCVTSIIAITK